MASDEPISPDASSGVTLVLDEERLRIVDAKADAWGYTRAELLALDAFALFPRWWIAGKNVGAEQSTSTLVRHKSGREALVEIRFSRGRFGDRRAVIFTVRNERDLSAVERELEETNRYLHAIVENIPDMIFVKDAATHAFRRFNRAGEELLGFTRGELLGKTDHDFYPKEQADFFHLKDRETFERREIVDIPQEPIETKLKGPRILHTRKIPIYDAAGSPMYLLGISEDITERIAAERRLRELADVVHNLRDSVVTLDPNGNLVSWNPAAATLYGLVADEARGAKFSRFLREVDLPAFESHLRAVLGGEEIPPYQATRVGAGGREIDIEETMLAVRDDHGVPNRVACIARDLTDLERWRRAAQALNPSRAPDSSPRSTVRSRAMAGVLDTADRVAHDRDATVLLLGETGVGKSWLARRIHRNSPRADRPFFELNCAGLAQQLLESELFGHEKGAFTGAATFKRGLVETAEGGTLFLDEVGELNATVQAQLLTFLDGKSFRRVGGNRLLSADVRIVAATNVDLKRAADAGTFRRDLYYRLSVVPVTVPPLRDRREEISDLAITMLGELGRRAGRRSVTLGEDALRALEAYEWPGNIRELRNALERALILTTGAELRAEDLPLEIREPRSVRVPGSARGRDEPRALSDIEREQIAKALEKTGGNRTKAAELLGISRATLKRRLADMRRKAGDTSE